MTAQILIVLACVPLIALGAMHLVFTLKDHKRPRYIVPRSECLIRDMQTEPLRLTKETTMWKAWIGFNISHSMAVLMVGVGYLYLAVKYFSFLQQDFILLWTAPVLAWIFVILAKCFWFSKPLRGSFVSALLYTAGAFFA